MNNRAVNVATLGVEPSDRTDGPSLSWVASTQNFTLILMAHALAAWMMWQSESIATIHALLTLAVGLSFALKGQQERVIYVAAYIVGAEVLWRMTGARVFWEMGKYSVSLVLLLALIRTRRDYLPLLPFFFFLLLLPSIALVLFEPRWSLDQIRQQISFNLSGPFSLFICAWFFDGIKLDTMRFRHLLLALLAPIIGIAIVALANTLTAGPIDFYGSSNVVTSGGFGPNQVSAMLGLGTFAAFLLLLIGNVSKLQRLLYLGLLLWLVVQSLLTFSRTGVVLAFLASVATALLLLSDARARLQVLLLALFLFAATQFIIVPQLDAFTQGTFTVRYTDTSLTGRDEIAALDLDIWRQHLLDGVGPGRAVLFRSEAGHGASAHTEFTRLVAEHGMLGLLALLLLAVMMWHSFLRSRGGYNRAVVGGFLIWVVGFMIASAFRLVAPAFALGVTIATLRLDNVNAPLNQEEIGSAER